MLRANSEVTYKQSVGRHKAFVLVELLPALSRSDLMNFPGGRLL